MRCQKTAEQKNMHDTEKLEQLIEAILFYRGEPVRTKDVARAAHASDDAVSDALSRLGETLHSRGIRLVREGEFVALATAPETKETIEAMRREEREGPLGKAGLETLAVIIYHGPLSRAEVEYIRGVNSSSILRSLSMRGLIEKIDNPKDRRSFLYRVTPELPAALGVTSLAELPNFTAVREDIAAALNDKEAGEVSASHTHDE